MERERAGESEREWERDMDRGMREKVRGRPEWSARERVRLIVCRTHTRIHLHTHTHIHTHQQREKSIKFINKTSRSQNPKSDPIPVFLATRLVPGTFIH